MLEIVIMEFGYIPSVGVLGPLGFVFLAGGLVGATGPACRVRGPEKQHKHEDPSEL